ncbi:uncharacterized protein LOC113115245 [Carassius auratus]|uniref:Uncharacterized protein LOC113115245 n=1 Tax=Carassius auratus TaxID=7957 RepID=A0A6P6QYZ6_CARAU|nr:uncharacterized protein LOC113115245 [Carassius auratus]
MSSYWVKRRQILKGVERDKQEIAAANDALLAVIPDFDQVNPPVNEHQPGMAPTSHGQTVEEDQPFAVVLQVWLSKGMCYWPPFNLRKKDKGNNLAIRCTPPHSTWEKHNFKFMKGAESWQEAMRYLVCFQTGSSVETMEVDKKRKRISNSKYRPQASSDEEESSLPDAPAVLSFGQPLLSFENIVPCNMVSALPNAPEVALIPENQENVVPSVGFRGQPGFSPEIQTPLHRAKSLSTRHLTGYSPQQFLDERCRARQVLSFTPPAANLPWQHMGENAGGESHRSVIGPWTPLASCVQHEVFSYEDFQRLQNEKQGVMDENQALREENQALRESTARAASDDSGSLQEQVKQVGTMLKTFARTGQSGADQTLML